MNTRATVSAAMILGAAALALTGCSAAPAREDVAERFAIELHAAMGVGDLEDYAEAGDGMAGSALDGMCGSETFRTALSDEDLIRAWDTGCLMYFEDDMTESQVERVKLHLLSSLG